MAEREGGGLPGGARLGHWLVFLFLGSLLFLAAALVQDRATLAGAQLDADGYMRLARLLHLVEGGGWYNHVIPWSNWPYGDPLHWTRPLDLLILLLALPLFPFIETSQALALAGGYVSPLLFLATGLALIWVGAPITPSATRALAAPFLLAQPVTFTYGLIGRADHHLLIIFLYALAVGLALRWFTEEASREDRNHEAPNHESGGLLPQHAAAWAGVLMALGLWVSTEFLLPLGLLFLGGGLFWLLRGEKAVQGNLKFAMGLSTGLLLAMMVERPLHDWLNQVYDRISIVHLTVGLLATAFWLLVRRFTGTERGPLSVGARALTGGVGAVTTGLILHLLHPGFFHGPWVHVPQDVREVWLQHVAELQRVWGSSLGDIGMSVAILGLTLPAAAYLVHRIFTASRCRLASAFLFVSLLVFSVMTALQLRWGAYLGILIPVVMAALLGRIRSRLQVGEWKATREVSSSRRFLYPVAVVAMIPGVLIVGFFLMSLEEHDRGARMVGASPDCQVSEIAPELMRLATQNGENVALLTHLDRGPEILFRTRIPILSGPYHRNHEGIRDLLTLFRTEIDQETAQLMARRQIGIILVCPATDAGLLAQGHENSLYHRLVDGDLPSWIRPFQGSDLTAGRGDQGDSVSGGNGPTAEDTGFLIFTVGL